MWWRMAGDAGVAQRSDGEGDGGEGGGEGGCEAAVRAAEETAALAPVARSLGLWPHVGPTSFPALVRLVRGAVAPLLLVAVEGHPSPRIAHVAGVPRSLRRKWSGRGNDALRHYMLMNFAYLGFGPLWVPLVEGVASART